MKDNICKEATTIQPAGKKMVLEMPASIRDNKIYLLILGFLIFSWTAAR